MPDLHKQLLTHRPVTYLLSVANNLVEKLRDFNALSIRLHEIDITSRIENNYSIKRLYGPNLSFMNLVYCDLEIIFICCNRSQENKGHKMSKEAKLNHDISACFSVSTDRGKYC